MPSVALSMIVRNEEADLPACLESVRGVVSEMVVADTGSSDATRAIARRFGARVLSIPWEQDFARARNLALRQVQADWVLVLDADEVLDPAGGRSIAELLDRFGVDGYLVDIRNYMLDLAARLWDRPAKANDSALEAARAYPAYVEHENVRLFRRHPDIYFVGRVHETVGPRLVETGRTLERANFVIHHFGMVAPPETRARKNHLYRELGRVKIHDMPENAQAHFELGLVEFDNFHNDAEALACFERACRLNPRFSTAWFFAGLALLRLERPGEALPYLQQAEACGHAQALVAEAQGDAHYNLGHFEQARCCYGRAARRTSDSAELESKLGLAEVRVGRVAGGLARLCRTVQRAPQTAELYDRLLLATVWLGLLDEAAAVVEAKLAALGPHPDTYLRLASIRARQGQAGQAAEVLRTSLGRFQEAEKLRIALAELEGRKKIKSGVGSQ